MKTERVVIESGTISEEALARAIHMTPDSEDEDWQQVCRLAMEAAAVARPKFVFGVAAVERLEDDAVVIDGHRFVSPLMRRNLASATCVYPYVATCGLEVEAWSKAYQTDPLEQYWTDAIKQLLMASAVKELHDRVRQIVPAADLSRMSPGSLPEWPITAQPELFALIGDVTGLVGVRLTESCLMLPAKSVSGLFFTAAEHFENCALCPLTNCPSRRVPYRGETQLKSATGRQTI